MRAATLGALADLGFRGLDNDVRDPVIVTRFTASRAHKPTPGTAAQETSTAPTLTPGTPTAYQRTPTAAGWPSHSL
jgi:hypothetical protein